MSNKKTKTTEDREGNFQAKRDKALLEALHTISENYSLNEGDVILREVSRLHQNNKYLRQQNLFIWIVVIILSLGLIITTSYFLYQYPKSKFIVTTDNKAVCEVAALDKPHTSSASIESFAAEAVLEINRYDYINYEEQISKTLNRYFTKEGKQGYYISLSQSGNLVKVKANKMISRAILSRSPQIEKESIKQGQYTWLVIVPITNEFYVGNDNIETQAQSKQNYYAQVTIVQEAATAINPKGIAVQQLILKPI